jgi:hypothetical protein
MYRIELSPGEETAFRSIEELAVAIRRGVVGPRARIWHNATGKWLPIQFHPHYKIAASMQLTKADLVAGAPVKPLELLTLGELMDPPAPPMPQVMRPEQAPRVKRIAVQERKPLQTPVKKAPRTPRRSRAGRRPIRIALAGALLIGCAHLALIAASFGRVEEEIAVRPRTQRRLVTTPMLNAQQGGPETTAAAVLPGLPMVPRPGARSISTPPITQTEAATPLLNAFPRDSEEGIQPAPASSDIAAPTGPVGDSLAKRMVDSTGKKNPKRILRTVSGAPPTEQKSRRR